MKIITNLFNYLEEYSIYYLSRYSVSKKKFEYVLSRKVSKDFLSGKLCSKQKSESEEIIKKISSKFVSKNVIKEELIIDNKIAYLLNKGTSIKKIENILIRDKFEKFLINMKINELLIDVDLDSRSLDKFCKKKLLGKYNTRWDTKNEKNFTKTLSKLLREGFRYEICKNFLDQD